jgi:hypothetical protein
MYFFTALAGFLFVYAIMSVTRSIRVGGGDADDDAVLGPRLPDSEDSSECSSDSESEDMKDFYDETTLSPEWLTKSDKEKKFILDKELDEYMSKNKDL